MKTHKDLDLWKESISLVTELYKITRSFPDVERYGLVSQLSRAAVSVPANISEEEARSSRRDYVRFLRIGFGSLSELETLVIISGNLEYLVPDMQRKILERIKKISAQFSGLIKSLERLT